MHSKLTKNAIFEADNSLEVSLREAEKLLEPQLRPPFPLKLPTQEEYFNLNKAILCGILCEPQMARVHIKHLHAIVTDGYTYFISMLIKIVNELYAKLVDSNAAFLDISQLYLSRTSSRYFLLRITPEMENQLRFLLTHVKLGNQKRYQVWFAKKFLGVPERETLLTDIVRFICCGHHPPNEIIQSDIIPRWAVIGWLLKSSQRNYVEANVKLALFYDWLFFDEKVDNIMNIEPGILLMIHSIPSYVDITHTLLEFLLMLVENYDIERKDVIVKGISSAFTFLVRKGVVRSLDALTCSDVISPFLKQLFGKIFKDMLASLSERAVAKSSS
ncbi:unnamed protein product [Coffea canephora]|uniref:Integrator complex subunit 3 N-terminal domain-containing protein n=1 Tax=Coffea canephora TaxID=49390 RepID=A0A068V2X4_COFCA|nr:unnamed protein product [Coffea canephora]